MLSIEVDTETGHETQLLRIRLNSGYTGGYTAEARQMLNKVPENGYSLDFRARQSRRQAPG